MGRISLLIAPHLLIAFLLLILTGCGESVEERLRRELRFCRSEKSQVESELGAKNYAIGVEKEKAQRALAELNSFKVHNRDLETQLAKVKLDAKEKEEYINLAASNERHRRDLMKRIESLENEVSKITAMRDSLKSDSEHLHNFLELVGAQKFVHWASNVDSLSDDELQSFGSASLSLGISEGVLKISSKLINPAIPAKLNVGSSVQVDSYDLSIDYKSSLCQLHFPNAKEIKSALKLSESNRCDISIKLNDTDVILGFLAPEKKWFSKDLKFDLISVRCGDTEISLNKNFPNKEVEPTRTTPAGDGEV
ncbi:hypothetical protein PDESU_03999 [Pontiella desulfatans]|uniref:Chromosome partition protein Smc n=2 Tax=Pontiella desulfatans TaxID=2750659 RepID=A0A6C2U7M9_PONDE|nr:hypothetical protein PDESU_03999 [Pontiella desulfatans]